MVKWMMPKKKRGEQDTRTHARRPPKGMKAFEIYIQI